MNKKSKKTYSMKNISFLLFFLLIIIVSALIIKPFFTILIVSAILAYIFYPAYEGFLMMFKRKSVAAGTVIILLLLLVLFPLALLVGTVTKESIDVYHSVKDYVDDGGAGYCDDSSRVGCTSYLYIKEFGEKNDLNIGSYLKEGSAALAAGLVGKVSKFVFDLPLIFLQFFFILFITYYFLKEGKGWLKGVRDALPLDEKVKGSVFTQFDDVMHATLYGAVILAIIQGAIAALAYFLLGAPSPLLFGFLTLIAVFIPFVGGALVWVPLSLYMLIQGIMTSNNVIVMKALGIFLFGLFVISTIDNILKPKIVGDKAKMHPLVILLGVFGGITVFGIIGILIGPLILALFVTSLKIYEKQRKHLKI